MGYLFNPPFVEGLSNDAVCRQYTDEVRSRWRSSRPFGFDTLVETIAEPYIGISAGTGTERIKKDIRYPGYCGVKTPAYDGSTKFDSHVPIQPYANAARRTHADSNCSPHGFDRARAHEPRCNCQAWRRTTCLHW